MTDKDQAIIQGDDVFSIAPPQLKFLQDAMPAINLRCAYVPMGAPDDPQVPGVVMLEMNPGRVLEHHAHACWRFETVIRGSLYVGDKVLVPGDIMTAAPHEFYGPHTAGPEGCLTAEVFGEFGEAVKPIFKHPDGSERAYDYGNNEFAPDEILEFNKQGAPVVPGVEHC